MNTDNVLKYVRASVLAAIVVPLSAQAAGPPGGINVRVVNEAADPVPVTGAVEVEGGVGVTGDVRVTNTPDVNVTNTPDVNVTNSVRIDDSTPINVNSDNGVNPTDFVSLRSDDRNTCSVGGGIPFFVDAADGSNSGFGGTFVVPDGKLLVVTSVQYSAVLAGPPLFIEFHFARVSADGTGRNSAFWSREVPSENGVANGRQAMPTGIVFGPGVEPCLDAIGVPPAFVRGGMQGFLMTP